MVKVITYGTFDLLHYGHTRLLERAKSLGDYLIVGVTSDDFDRKRGKINVRQSLMERVEAVKATGIPDEVIIEEYEGQKIDDIRKYGIDIFTVGSDWRGKFDYLRAYCDVVYLPRTEGISSTEIRSDRHGVSIGIVGETPILKKIVNESRYVNGCTVSGICSEDEDFMRREFQLDYMTRNFGDLLERSDAVYIASHPSLHYTHIKDALTKGKHVLCESPLALSGEECAELFSVARSRNCVLMDAIKTAYSTAYARMLLLVKSGMIGKVVSVDSVCTSIKKYADPRVLSRKWNSLCEWGPTGLLPVFQLLGVDFRSARVLSSFADREKTFDTFSKIDLEYDRAVASVRVGNGVKSEGELVISGTEGYIYVPAPWWKTDYFEVRYENQEQNKRYFYQLDGEGIRYEIVAFLKAIQNNRAQDAVSETISEAICRMMSVKKTELLL